MSTHEYLRASVPPLLSAYRKTSFTLQDGLSEWKGDGRLIFAVKDENRIGMLRLDRHRNYYDLSSFVVDPAYQSFGYGGKLLRHAIQSTELPIWLRVQRDNPACALYLRNGFEQKDLVNNRYSMKYQRI
jgi:ribosomal protein S18 acetylase RimI-like enzyme